VPVNHSDVFDATFISGTGLTNKIEEYFKYFRNNQIENIER
jgi:hypothetical protein